MGGQKLVIGGEKSNAKSTKGLGGDGTVLYLDCGDGA